MTDTTITHPELVAALLKPGAAITSSLTDSLADLWHNGTGVAGEAGEILAALYPDDEEPTGVLDRENVVEELGDLEFYLEGIRQNRGIDREETMFLINADEGLGDLFDDAGRLVVACTDLLDVIKKAAIYVKPIDTDVFIDALAKVEKYLERFRVHTNVFRPETIAANIYKLGTGPNARYKKLSYSNEAAIERADKA